MAPLSDEEWKMYQDIQFDMENYKNKVGVSQLMYNNKVRTSGGIVWGGRRGLEEAEPWRRRSSEKNFTRRWTC